MWSIKISLLIFDLKLERLMLTVAHLITELNIGPLIECKNMQKNSNFLGYCGKRYKGKPSLDFAEAGNCTKGRPGLPFMP